MNLREETEKIKAEGYIEATAEARLCQDIILMAISESSLKNNVTIKGGVVMRNLSGSARRATLDIDLDFIRYSISDNSIKAFINKINGTDNLTISIKEPIKELNHQDYKGKRVIVNISDSFGNSIDGKIDIGIHKDFDLKQEEYCFDLCFQKDGVSLLMNSKEQIISEKLKSLLRFMSRNTRYKDVYDIYFLIDSVNSAFLKKCIKNSVFADSTLAVSNFKDINMRLNLIFNNELYITELERSRKNWLDIDTKTVLSELLAYFKKLEN